MHHQVYIDHRQYNKINESRIKPRHILSLPVKWRRHKISMKTKRKTKTHIPTNILEWISRFKIHMDIQLLENETKKAKTIEKSIID